jgi:flagellin
MTVINTNTSAAYAQNAMKTNARFMSKAMEQLSTGSRVNSAGDDAAGLAIGQNMTSQIRGLSMAIRNVNDGINMMQTSEGAMVEQSNMLQRMRELAIQAMNGTYSDVQRGYLDKEFQELTSQIDQIAKDTMWNDQSLLTGSGGATSNGVFTFQAGQDADQTISVTIGAMTKTGLSLVSGGVTVSIDSGTTAADALDVISAALETINEQRAALGAGINRMQYTVDNLANIASNQTQSRSTILDTDYAIATTQLAKTQIIQQASTAMLAQANQQAQAVMALLK